jgi:peptide/nickel transport system ATP-binding protein
MTTTPLLEVRNLSRTYRVGGSFLGRRARPLRAVIDVSFSVAPGETLALVGESGCGKSTLGRAVLRLEQPDAGQVLHRGTDLLALDRRALFERRRALQMIFQDPYGSLNPRLTVAEIIAEPLVIHRLGRRTEREQRVRELLDQVGLAQEMATRYPHEFSGGQRQRIGIARALALNPEFIVADEPVSALDVSVQAQIINLLVRLQRERGLAYLFISHDLNVVEYLADRVAIMYLGRIVESAPRAALFARPAHPYTRALIEASPVPDPTRRRTADAIQGEIPSPLAPPPGCAFHTRCPFAIEACRQTRPEPRPVPGSTPDHTAACHRLGEV